MNLFTAVLAGAAIVFVLIRRFAGEPLDGRRLVVLPLVVTILGATQLGDLHFNALDIAVLTVEGVAAAALGAVRGLTVHVYSRDGHLWYRYRPLTIAVWIASILLRVVQTAAGHALGADTKVLSAALLAMLGLSLLAEALVVGKRALDSGVPFAPQGARRAR